MGRRGDTKKIEKNCNEERGEGLRVEGGKREERKWTDSRGVR